MQAMPKDFNQNVKKNKTFFYKSWISFTFTHDPMEKKTVRSVYLLFVHILSVTDNCQKMTSLSLFLGSKDVGKDCGSGTSWRCSGSR